MYVITFKNIYGKPRDKFIQYVYSRLDAAELTEKLLNSGYTVTIKRVEFGASEIIKCTR